MVGSVSITFMVLQGILAIGAPLVLLIYFRRKYHMSWKPVLIGLLIFIVFVSILEKLLHYYVLEINSYTQTVLDNPYFYVLYAGLAAGLFEEVGRYIGFRYLLKSHHNWQDGIAYGIGHGGVEALLVGGLTSVSFIVNAYLLNTGGFDTLLQSTSGSAAESIQNAKDQLVNTPAYIYLLGGLERIFAFIYQLGFSLLVLCSVRYQKVTFLLYALLAHAAVDFVAGLYQTLGLNIFIVETFNLAVALAAIVFIIKAKHLLTSKHLDH